MDVNTAVMQPKKVQYIEETIRAMESGDLKIRVRSLENEKALERMGIRQTVMESLLMSAILFNVAGLVKQTVARNLGIGGACFFLFQGLMTNVKLKKFDKTQNKYVTTKFQDEDDLADQ